MTQDDLPVCDLAASKSATSLSAFSESDDNIQSTVDSHPMTGRKSSLTKSLDGLKGHKNKNLRNPFLAYLNINHLRNKIIDLRCILKEISIEYIAISETKLDGSLPDSQFKIMVITSSLSGETGIAIEGALWYTSKMTLLPPGS